MLSIFLSFYDWFGSKMKLTAKKMGILQTISFLMQQLSRSLSRLETQDMKTQPQFNHYMNVHLKERKDNGYMNTNPSLS